MFFRNDKSDTKGQQWHDVNQDSTEIKNSGPLPLLESATNIVEPNWGDIEPVGGRFGVAATLPTTEHVMAYEEGTIQLPQGYYRLVTHPCTKAIQQSCQAFYDIRHAILFPSLAASLTEYIDYLQLSRPDLTVIVVRETDTSLNVTSIVSATSAHVVQVSAYGGLTPNLPATTLTPESLVLLVVGDPQHLVEKELSWFKLARKQRAILAGVSPLPPNRPWPLGHIPHWFCGLGQPAPGIDGGAHLTRIDMQADEIRERQKKRGPILSARNSAIFLGEPIPSDYVRKIRQLEQDLCSELAGLEQAHHALLFPSGMCAITACLDHIHATQRRKIIVVGHLYSDTHILLSEFAWPGGEPFETHFIEANEDDRLQTLLDDQTGCVFVETITNPLNQVPHLPRIIRACKQQNTLIIVDNTLATPAGCKPLMLGADIVLYSTTKHISGKNDHGGGLLLTNRDDLRDIVQAYQEARGLPMSGLEMTTLAKNMQDLDTRLPRFQANAQTLAEALHACDMVDQVYYAGLPSSQWHSNANEFLQGYGSVVSFTLKEKGLDAMRCVYDTPFNHITKSPSLGSNQTLLCPYTMLTYYQKSDDYLASIGLERHLLRVAVGCEKDFAPVLSEILAALQYDTS